MTLVEALDLITHEQAFINAADGIANLLADARRDERIRVLRELAAEISDDTYPMCPDSWSSMLDDRANALEKGTGPLLPRGEP